VTVAAIAAGGALGALARYGLDSWIEQRVDALFPWATFVVNVSGCFAAALAVNVVVDRLGAPSWLGLGLTVGFLGAYTTFSTYAFEAYELLELRHVVLAVVYVAASAAAGVTAIALGHALAAR
jgi:fluoride exporter